MKIDGNINSVYPNPNSETFVKKASDTNQSVSRANSRTDRVEISARLYDTRSNDEELTATSGKDVLRITKGSKDGSFTIHFSDSAIVSRAVSRGYLTVNGTKVELTDEIKKQLMQVDKQAQKDREQAFNEYIMQHELAVAQQQSEAYQKVSDDMSKALEIAEKLSKGAMVSPAEQRQLLEMNPQLYAMSKIAASMNKQQKQDEQAIQMPEKSQMPGKTTTHVDAASIEWKTYDTRLNISMKDTIQLQGVFEGEVNMKM